MSEPVKTGATKYDEGRSVPQVSAPLLQRVYWVVASVAAVSATLVGLTALAINVNATMFQIILVALSIGILTAALVMHSGSQRRMDWLRGADALADTRKNLEYLVLNVVRLYEEDKKAPLIRSVLETTLEACLKSRAFVRAAYRVALVMDQKELAADILLEMIEYTEWIEKLSSRLNEIRAANTEDYRTRKR